MTIAVKDDTELTEVLVICIYDVKTSQSHNFFNYYVFAGKTLKKTISNVTEICYRINDIL